MRAIWREYDVAKWAGFFVLPYKSALLPRKVYYLDVWKHSCTMMN